MLLVNLPCIYSSINFLFSADNCVQSLKPSHTYNFHITLFLALQALLFPSENADPVLIFWVNNISARILN